MAVKMLGHLFAVLASVALALPLHAHQEGAERTVVEAPRAVWEQLQIENAALDILGSDTDGMVQALVDRSTLEKVRASGFAARELPLDDFFATDVSRYRQPDEVLEAIWQWTQQHPAVARSFEAGLSTEGRPIMALELGYDTDTFDAKPTVLFNGMHHAREVMSAEVVFDIADHILDRYQEDEEIAGWLRDYRIIVIPQVNPDGNQRVHDGERMWRKNAWRYRDRVTGVDLNRNYPAYWNHCGGSSSSRSAQNFRGPSAASEPETQALMRVVADYQPIFDISYHSYSELIIFPFGCRGVENDARSLFDSVGRAIRSAVIDDAGRADTYRLGTAPELLYEADGTDLDWQWAEHNVVAYTLEVNSRSQGFQPDYDRWRDKTVVNQRGGWKALLRRLGQGGVQAQVVGEDVRYVLERHNGQAFALWRQGLGGREERALRPQGLLFQLLPAGEYRLRVADAQGAMVTRTFRVAGKTVSLGTLAL